MWNYNGIEFTEDMVGENQSFVYIIINNLNAKRYIGKKQLYFSKTRQIKGKKKRFKVVSDWKTYYGSNRCLQDDVKAHGQENFTRIIIKLCKTKSDASYWETYHIFQVHALLLDRYYNEWVTAKISKKHLNITADDVFLAKKKMI